MSVSKGGRSLADKVTEPRVRHTNEVVVMHINEQTFELSFDLDDTFIDESDIEGENECTQCGTEFEMDTAEDK